MGLATDGPNYIPVQSDTDREILRLFGAQYTERLTVTATASTLQLDYEPLDRPQNSVNSRVDYLYNPTVSGSILLFGSVGGSGASVDLTYTPYLGKEDLLWAVRKWYEESRTIPYVMRVGGTYATANVQGWSFISRYAGAKYNSCTLSYTGGVFTVTGMEPNYPTLTYTASAHQLKPLMDRDFDLGLSPVRVQTATRSLTGFSSTALSGGADGSMDQSTFQNFFDLATVPYDVSHILFLTPVTSGFTQLVAQEITDGTFQPRLFFMPLPSYVSPASSYVQSLSSSIPYRHSMIVGVLGTAESTLRTGRRTRWAAECAALGFALSNSYNLTNVKVPAITFDPQLSENDLKLMKLNGFLPLNRYIYNDIGTYEGCVMGLNQSFLFSSKTAEVQAIAANYLQRFFGQSLAQGPQPSITLELNSRLSAINWLKIESVDCTVLGDVLYCTVTGSMPGEILDISFQVRNF